MAKSNDINYMKIHFTWINWSLENHKSIREKIAGASEDERIVIAKHAGLDNQFLIRRIKDVVFQSLIYYRILSDKDVFRRIMPKVTEILSKNLLYAEEITKLLKEEAPKANIVYPFDDHFEKLLKLEGTNEATVEYLQLLLKYHVKNDDIENIAIVRAYLKEYKSSMFKISDLFQNNFIYIGTSYPLKQEFAVKSFLIENVRNFLYYESLDYPHQDFRAQLSSLFSYPLRTKLKTLAFQILDLEQTQETLVQYPIFFNHLLSIASMLYFKNLTIEGKLELLNSTNELDDLINLLQNYDFEWDFINWKFSSTYLLRAGLYELALQLNEIMLKNHFDKIRSEDKYFFYDGLGTIHRNLGNYDKALEFYQEAFKWIDTASLKGFLPLIEGGEGQGQTLDVNRDYQKGVCLKNIGENLGRKGDYDEMIKKFVQVEKIVNTLEYNSEKYKLYMNLSIASRRLHRFESERIYVHKALAFLDGSIPLEQVEQRIDIFALTEMSFDKLMKIEIKKRVGNYFKIGKILSQINNFRLSIVFYEKALEVSGEVSEINIQKKFHVNIFRGMAISFFLLRDWENAKKFLTKYLALEEDFESELYYFIILYLIGDKEKSRNQLIKIIKGFKESAVRLILINDWLVQIVNTFGKNTFIDFISTIENLNDELQEFILYKFGNALADNGFSKLALQFFERELNLLKDEKIIATVYNDIGGVYSDLDDYEKAIDDFKKALELDKEYDLCYRNLAEIYSRKLDNISAKQYLEKAIEIAKKQGKPEVQVYEQELKQVNQLLENVLNLNDISSIEIKNILISAERKFVDYRNKSDDFDASDIIISYSKALERILDEQMAIHFKPLIQKYKRTKKQTSEDFNKKFKWLFQEKTISLGTWARIFRDFKKSSLELGVEEFKKHLELKFSKAELNAIQKICEVLVKERNKISHWKALNIRQVVLIRKKIVPLLNQAIKILYF